MEKRSRIDTGSVKKIALPALALGLASCASTGERLADYNLEVRDQLEKLGVAHNSNCKDAFESDWGEVDRGSAAAKMKWAKSELDRIIASKNGELSPKKHADGIIDNIESSSIYMIKELEGLKDTGSPDLKARRRVTEEFVNPYAECLGSMGYDSHQIGEK